MMKVSVCSLLVLAILAPILHARPQVGDIVTTTSETPQVDVSTPAGPANDGKPIIYSLNVRSDVRSRYARTLVTSKIGNPADRAQEVTFQVTIPESAFVSKFVMKTDDEVLEGIVKERFEAKTDYYHAVQSGQTAGHVATASVRDSSHVRVSVNVAPRTKASFNLTYEELLVRRKGRYELAINLTPGQVVSQMGVDVYIQETKNITQLKVPTFKSTNEIDFDESGAENSDARVEWISGHQAHVQFAPDEEAQKRISGEKGLGGKFIVRYDVEREPGAGEVLALDGYFVHFFSPPELKPLPKHVVFVLDVSGSMHGRKIEQLQEAMNAIMGELRPKDFFNIIEFSSSVTILDLETPVNNKVLQSTDLRPSRWYADVEEGPMPVEELPTSIKTFPASQEFVLKAKATVKNMTANGGTNIHDAVRAALLVCNRAVPHDNSNITLPEPLVIFLTDGEATVGETRSDKILKLFNDAVQVPTFSLAFGQDADLPFLKRLSLRSGAFARKIYEAADAALQLQDFYRQVASPLLSKVSFKYLDTQVDGSSVTKQKFDLLFSGSELVVAGKLREVNTQTPVQLGGEVQGSAADKPITYPMLDDTLPLPGVVPPALSTPSPQPGDRFLERLWAYLSIRQLLDKYEAERDDSNKSDQPDEPSSAESAKSKALQLALKFSFVTPVTSLIVVKTNNASTTTQATPSANNTEKVSVSTTTSTPIALQFGAIDPQPHDLADYSTLLSASPNRFSSRPQPVASYSGGYAGGSNYLFAAPKPVAPPAFPRAPSPVSRPAYIMSAPQPTSFNKVQVQQESFIESEIELTTLLEDKSIENDQPAAINTTRVELSYVDWLEFENSTGDEKWQLVRVGNSSESFKLLYTNQSVAADDLKSCMVPSYNGPDSWTCRPLAECVLAEFAQDKDKYLTNFKCMIGTENFLGACCPSENTTSPPDTTTPVISNADTVQPESSDSAKQDSTDKTEVVTEQTTITTTPVAA